MSELDPEYRAAWEAWSTAALSGAPHEEVRRLWRVVNDVLARAESPVVMESSSCGCCGAMFDRQAGPDPDRWCKPCTKSRAVAGGEPPAWTDPSDLTRISLAAAARDFGAGGEPTRPSEQEWLQALLAAYDDWYGGRGWQGRFAPLIERERADAAAQERNRLRLKALWLHVYQSRDVGRVCDADAVMTVFEEPSDD